MAPSCFYLWDRCVRAWIFVFILSHPKFGFTNTPTSSHSGSCTVTSLYPLCTSAYLNCKASLHMQSEEDAHISFITSHGPGRSCCFAHTAALNQPNNFWRSDFLGSSRGLTGKDKCQCCACGWKRGGCQAWRMLVVSPLPPGLCSLSVGREGSWCLSSSPSSRTLGTCKHLFASKWSVEPT